jgi:hypothetical protein
MFLSFQELQIVLPLPLFHYNIIHEYFTSIIIFILFLFWHDCSIFNIHKRILLEQWIVNSNNSMIYLNIAKIQMCKHLQNHLFIFFSFHNSEKHANKIIYEMGMYKSVERKFLHTKKNMSLEFFEKN